jgi:hypothetical protein
MQEKKLLSIEDIESQTFLDLPDRPAPQLLGTLFVLIFNLGGGGGGGAGGNSGSSGSNGSNGGH